MKEAGMDMVNLAAEPSTLDLTVPPFTTAVSLEKTD